MAMLGGKKNDVADGSDGGNFEEMELAWAPEQWLEGYTNIDGRVDAWCWYFRVARRGWCGMRSSRVCRRGGIGGVQVHWEVGV